jgi:antitoxin HicB
MERKKNRTELEYPAVIRPLSAEEGAGYLIEYPDLPGCRSDGETIAETIANGADAIACWIAAMKADGRVVPAPGSSTSGKAAVASGKWVQRVPVTVHARLKACADAEGVSLNALVTSFISAAIGLDATQTKALPQRKTKLAPAIEKARGKAAARSEAKGRRRRRAKA